MGLLYLLWLKVGGDILGLRNLLISETDLVKTYILFVETVEIKLCYV